MSDHALNFPPTPFELEVRRNAAVTAENEARERYRRKNANRRAGHDEPRPGDVLRVSLDRSLVQRRRAGLRFERGPAVDVEVIAAGAEEVEALQSTGRMVVGVDGAELILEDAALNVNARAPASDDVAELRSQREALEALEEELRVTRAELNEVRKARMNAPESKDGQPTRLPAARNARAAAATSATAQPAADGTAHGTGGAAAVATDFGTEDKK